MCRAGVFFLDTKAVKDLSFTKKFKSYCQKPEARSTQIQISRLSSYYNMGPEKSLNRVNEIYIFPWGFFLDTKAVKDLSFTKKFKSYCQKPEARSTSKTIY